MPNYIQELKQFSYGEESIWGSAPGTKNLWAGLVQNFAPKTKQNIKDVDYMGAGRDVGQLVKVASDTTFSFQMALQHGKIFQYVLGESVDAGAGPYTHTLDGDDVLKSLTLVYSYLDPAGSTDFNKEINGAVVNKVTVDIPERDVILATFEGFGKEPVNSVKQTLTAANTVPFLSAHSIISVDSGGGYSNISDIKTAQFSIDNGMQVFGDMGQFDIAEPRPGQRRYAVRFPRRFKSSIYWDYLVNGTEIDVKFTWTRMGGQDLAAFEFKDCRLESADQSPDIKGVQEEEPILKAKTCQVIFTDSIATY